jgi:hypothetical protein
MIRIQRGRGGWVTSPGQVSRIAVLTLICIALGAAGCASKKPEAVTDTGASNSSSQLGTTTASDSSLNQFQKGTLGGRTVRF